MLGSPQASRRYAATFLAVYLSSLVFVLSLRQYDDNFMAKAVINQYMDQLSRMRTDFTKEDLVCRSIVRNGNLRSVYIARKDGSPQALCYGRFQPITANLKKEFFAPPYISTIPAKRGGLHWGRIKRPFTREVVWFFLYVHNYTKDTFRLSGRPYDAPQFKEHTVEVHARKVRYERGEKTPYPPEEYLLARYLIKPGEFVHTSFVLDEDWTLIFKRFDVNGDPMPM